ncbi:hypothetical protein [Herminiimonas fonticola]|uniref:hypothetical protein n=1 Tax=Herminiimonas fonticola TaxID=303380 RepID=UPI000DD7F23A|nr:hypothetical protein [Herminiimonas fonticola]
MAKANQLFMYFPRTGGFRQSEAVIPVTDFFTATREFAPIHRASTLLGLAKVRVLFVGFRWSNEPISIKLNVRLSKGKDAQS